jgi:hypothetical protein
MLSLAKSPLAPVLGHFLAVSGTTAASIGSLAC